MLCFYLSVFLFALLQPCTWQGRNVLPACGVALPRSLCVPLLSLLNRVPVQEKPTRWTHSYQLPSGPSLHRAAAKTNQQNHSLNNFTRKNKTLPHFVSWIIAQKLLPSDTESSWGRRRSLSFSPHFTEMGFEIRSGLPQATRTTEPEGHTPGSASINPYWARPQAQHGGGGGGAELPRTHDERGLKSSPWEYFFQTCKKNKN